MLLLATAQIIGQITVAVLQTVPVPIGNGVKTCVPTTKGTIFVLYWILPAVAHFFLALFTFIKAWRLTSEDSSPSIASRIWSTVFSRYGLIFPICIVLVEFTQIIFYLVADEMQRAVSECVITCIAKRKAECWSCIHVLDPLTTIWLPDHCPCLPDGPHLQAHQQERHGWLQQLHRKLQQQSTSFQRIAIRLTTYIWPTRRSSGIRHLSSSHRRRERFIYPYRSVAIWCQCSS